MNLISKYKWFDYLLEAPPIYQLTNKIRQLPGIPILGNSFTPLAASRQKCDCDKIGHKMIDCSTNSQ